MKKSDHSILDFRVENSLDGEAWFCRKTSLKVENETKHNCLIQMKTRSYVSLGKLERIYSTSSMKALWKMRHANP
jgi:hypothetical protein